MKRNNDCKFILQVSFIILTFGESARHRFEGWDSNKGTPAADSLFLNMSLSFVSKG